MYSEKTFKNYIFWIQVKRFFLMVLFTIIGVAFGLLLGKLLEGTLRLQGYTNTLIIVFALVFFVMSLLLTAGTGKEVQDGYWKIAVLRKLTVIQKLLESSVKIQMKKMNLNSSKITAKQNEQKIKTKVIENDKDKDEVKLSQEVK